MIVFLYEPKESINVPDKDLYGKGRCTLGRWLNIVIVFKETEMKLWTLVVELWDSFAELSEMAVWHDG